ncbi:MAG: type II toxin-antitoxin system VapC family toxin [Prosthecobacter sp.]|nr:type II toxin-antitoxin system VapC family toxin [Prosthecobacter sp.]HBJ84911.1 PIN domain nuclease [Verrucomicrobiales bacterium]
MNLLLDTCAFIWLAMPQGMLSPEATRLINDPRTKLFLSDVSIWEMSLKHSLGKLSLPDQPRGWIPQQTQFHQIERLQLEQSAIYLSGELPRVHSDPFDRLLAAQAIESGMTLLSPDTPLSSLGASRIW